MSVLSVSTARSRRLSLKEQLSGRWFRLMMGIFTQIGPLLIYFAGGYLMIGRDGRLAYRGYGHGHGRAGQPPVQAG